MSHTRQNNGVHYPSYEQDRCNCHLLRRTFSAHRERHHIQAAKLYLRDSKLTLPSAPSHTQSTIEIDALDEHVIIQKQWSSKAKKSSRQHSTKKENHPLAMIPSPPPRMRLPFMLANHDGVFVALSYHMACEESYSLAHKIPNILASLSLFFTSHTHQQSHLAAFLQEEQPILDDSIVKQLLPQYIKHQKNPLSATSTQKQTILSDIGVKIAHFLGILKQT